MDIWEGKAIQLLRISVLLSRISDDVQVATENI